MTGSQVVSGSQVVVGRIRTLDKAAPTAEAFAIVDGRIAAVGTRAEAVAVAGPDAPVAEYPEGAILPGLMDAHNHHAIAGEEDLFRLGFPATATLDELIAAVEEYAEGLAPDTWIVGGLWGSNLVPKLSEGGPLARLDAAGGGRPVLLTDDSHHNKWASSEAMRRAGVFELDADPEGGHVVRDASGAPTGLLFEAAGALVERMRVAESPVDDEYHARCSERGIELLAAQGIVGFQDAAASLDTLRAFAKLDAEGRLKAWAVSSALINDTIFGTLLVGEPLLERAASTASAHHRPTWSKIFLDGVPPTRTGAFLAPYLPDEAHGHDHLGATLMPLDELEGWLRIASRHGLGVKIHCTGDAAVRMVLDAVEAVRADGVDTPVQIAHGQFVHPDDIPRFAALRVVAEISPFLWFPGVIPGALAEVLGEGFAHRLQPNRALLDAGASVVVGSDWPVSESPNPWHAVYGLVTRRDPTGQFQGELWPEQAITREEAIRAVTSASAEAMGLGDVTGRIRVGNSADFVVLDRDPFEVPVEELAGTTVRETWFAGERVYSAG